MFGSPLLNEGFEDSSKESILPSVLPSSKPTVTDDLNTKSGDAICLPKTTQTGEFINYINICRKDLDTSRSRNFFSQSIDKYKNMFQQLRAQYDNLIISGDSQNSLSNLTGNTSSSVNGQITSLTKKREELMYQVKKTQNEAQSHDRMFLDDIMHKKEKKELYPTLQDFALGLFVFGWVLISCVLIFIRATSPGGGLIAGIITFILLLIVSILVYGLLLYVA